MPLSLIQELWRLNKQQWKSPEEIEKLQLAKLQRQIKRAYEHTSYYRSKLDAAGIKPNSIRRLSDLQWLPLTTKSDVVAAGDALYAQDIHQDECVWMKTSGSSGSPLSLPFTKSDKDHRALKELRALMANGYNFSDKMLIFVEPRCVVKEKALPQKFGLIRRDYMSIYDSEEEQLNRINELQPEVIYGYTSTLRILGEVLAGSRKLTKPPKILMSSAELLDPATRRLIKEGFGIEPNDFYGSMEFGWIAWQCQERSGYHINSDCVIAECLKDGKPVAPGEEGELVITNLHSDAAPLIRYVTGDTVSFTTEKCKCGRTLPRIASVNGRLADCISLKDGRKLSPYVVTCAVEDVPGVRQFQVIQDKDGTINVNLLESRYEVDESRVRNAVEKALGSQEKIIVQLTSNLLLEPTGKFRVVKSYVDKTAAI